VDVDVAQVGEQLRGGHVVGHDDQARGAPVGERLGDVIDGRAAVEPDGLVGLEEPRGRLGEAALHGGRAAQPLAERGELLVVLHEGSAAGADDRAIGGEGGQVAPRGGLADLEAVAELAQRQVVMAREEAGEPLPAGLDDMVGDAHCYDRNLSYNMIDVNHKK
jgi:hypothetical protein